MFWLPISFVRATVATLLHLNNTLGLGLDLHLLWLWGWLTQPFPGVSADAVPLTLFSWMMLLGYITFLWHQFMRTRKSLTDSLRLNGLLETQAKLLSDHISTLKVTQAEHVQQSHLLRQKDEAIQSSLRNAYRLQMSVLTHEKMVHSFYENSFVWLQPCTLLTGDFFYTVTKEPYTLVAICDCTGHDVGAALLTVLCKNTLAQAIARNSPEKTNLILNDCRKKLMKHLAHNNQTIREGMDMALCTFSTKTGQLFFSGANRQMLLWRNKELIEVSGDRMPIGYHERMEPFNCSQWQLQRGDRVFLFSDGLYSQIGGEKGKCWKRTAFKQTIERAQSLPMDQQLDFLKQEFNIWKGKNEQTDDLLLVGFEME